MSVPIPGFIPVPGPETLELISIISLIAGVCAAAAGALVLLLNKRSGREKKNLPAWILICIGALLAVNHGLQLIF